MLPDRGKGGSVDFVSPFGAQATCLEGLIWDSFHEGQLKQHSASPSHQGFLYRSAGVLSGVK